MKEKKVWQTPRLIVLCRSEAQESVLLACKVHHHDNTHLEGPRRGNSRCHSRAPCWDNMCYLRSVS